MVEFFPKIEKTKQYGREKKRFERELMTLEMQAAFLVLQNKIKQRNLKKKKTPQNIKCLKKREDLVSISVPMGVGWF